jgi:hypothetical protein
MWDAVNWLFPEDFIGGHFEKKTGDKKWMLRKSTLKLFHCSITRLNTSSGGGGAEAIDAGNGLQFDFGACQSII